MKLLTKAIEDKLTKHPFGSQDKKGMKAKVLVKFFNPYGEGTWLITEGEKQEDGDWLLFGLCNLTGAPWDTEWGYVSLKEIESVHPFPFMPQLGIERDKFLEAGITVEEALPTRLNWQKA